MGYFNFENGVTPINDTNLNAMQDEIEGDITSTNSNISKVKTNMTIYTNADKSYNHTGANIYLQEPIQFQESKGNHNNLLEFNSNGIKIGAGINHIDVKGQINVSHERASGVTIYIYIRKNGIVCSQVLQYAPNATQTYLVNIFADYLDVEEGDLIQLYIAIDDSTFEVKGQGNAIITQMSVKVVD